MDSNREAQIFWQGATIWLLSAFLLAAIWVISFIALSYLLDLFGINTAFRSGRRLSQRPFWRARRTT